MQNRGGNMDFHDSKIETTMNRRTRPCLVKVGFLKGGIAEAIVKIRRQGGCSKRIYSNIIPSHYEN